MSVQQHIALAHEITMQRTSPTLRTTTDPIPMYAQVLHEQEQSGSSDPSNSGRLGRLVDAITKKQKKFNNCGKKYMVSAYSNLSRYSDNLEVLFRTLVTNINVDEELAKLRASMSKLHRAPGMPLQVPLYKLKSSYELLFCFLSIDGSFHGDFKE